MVQGGTLVRLGRHCRRRTASHCCCRWGLGGRQRRTRFRSHYHDRSPDDHRAADDHGSAYNNHDNGSAASADYNDGPAAHYDDGSAATSAPNDNRTTAASGA